MKSLSRKHYYGGRGRGIEFRFTNFKELIDDIGFRPSKNLTLDRIDTNGHYEVGNVRWTTNHSQQRNKRNNHWVTINNESKILSDWEKSTGINRKTITSRIERSGWCEVCAFTIPAHQKGQPRLTCTQ